MVSERKSGREIDEIWGPTTRTTARESVHANRCECVRLMITVTICMLSSQTSRDPDCATHQAIGEKFFVVTFHRHRFNRTSKLYAYVCMYVCVTVMLFIDFISIAFELAFRMSIQIYTTMTVMAVKTLANCKNALKKIHTVGQLKVH